MRQIKFRAWDKHGEIFRTEFYINFDGVLYYNSSIGIKKCTEDNYVLNQFTGLLDKNGKEIYEGDILNWDYCGTVEWNEWMKDPIYQVVYRDCYFVGGIGLKKDLFLHAFRFKHTEVVGNIYENPDLLK